jgi:hypothetical protein
MNPGDNVKIVSGPYKGMSGILKCQLTEKNTNAKERVGCWMIWIGNVLEIVNESEVEGGKND